MASCQPTDIANSHLLRGCCVMRMCYSGNPWWLWIRNVYFLTISKFLFIERLVLGLTAWKWWVGQSPPIPRLNRWLLANRRIWLTSRGPSQPTTGLTSPNTGSSGSRGTQSSHRSVYLWKKILKNCGWCGECMEDDMKLVGLPPEWADWDMWRNFILGKRPTLAKRRVEETNVFKNKWCCWRYQQKHHPCASPQVLMS